MKYAILISIVLLSAIPSQAQHRKHVLGTTFMTSPPFYQCLYCYKEISPNQFLPKAYATMREPVTILGTTTQMYTNGYYRFVDSLKKAGINDYNYFMQKWNEADTSCISSEIALHKSENIENNWLKTHKPGMYYVDKYTAMHTDGFVYYFDRTSNDTLNWSQGHGGRFSDSILQADKWYKIRYDEPEKPKSKKDKKHKK